MSGSRDSSSNDRTVQVRTTGRWPFGILRHERRPPTPRLIRIMFGVTRAVRTTSAATRPASACVRVMLGMSFP